uniref:Uncharacterized protein n=1 Tax=Strombidium inclinatum TaxID=197538 RepID=A0A7S3IEY7_9SPIT|mmetsp:Transcript_13327/g.20823  ORF Transcript_13327/g.20823 Transcript_13327/m.20823 type:complete len:247 (+) Transcript_13327:92-832(+)
MIFRLGFDEAGVWLVHSIIRTARRLRKEGEVPLIMSGHLVEEEGLFIFAAFTAFTVFTVFTFLVFGSGISAGLALLDLANNQMGLCSIFAYQGLLQLGKLFQVSKHVLQAQGQSSLLLRDRKLFENTGGLGWCYLELYGFFCFGHVFFNGGGLSLNFVVGRVHEVIFCVERGITSCRLVVVVDARVDAVELTLTVLAAFSLPENDGTSFGVLISLSADDRGRIRIFRDRHSIGSDSAGGDSLHLAA